MAPSRGKGKAKATPTRRAASRSARKAKDGSPDIYGDMLAEAAAHDAAQSSDRPLKRRRVLREVSIPKQPVESASSKQKKRPAAVTQSEVADDDEASGTESISHRQQTIEASSDASDPDESDFAFEDVDLGGPAASSKASGDEDEGIADVNISVAPEPSRNLTASRRKASTAPEKAFRLLVHKAHILTLLGHCMYVNTRCDNPAVHKSLRHLLDKKMLSYLNPKTNDTQFQRNRSFMDGLEMAKNAFKAEYEVTASGMSRARWPADEDQALAHTGIDPIDRSDFIATARRMEGSQDTGNQLFCAMLRAAGVDARLVCSLQTLPFASAPAKSSTSKKYKKPAVFAIASDTDPNASDASVSDNNIGSSVTIGKVPSARRRLGQTGFAPEPAPKVTPKKKKTIRTLSYPIFWVEAFNAAQQKWITVDATVTNTVGKPSKIEPPVAYDLNQLTYAIAFESDGVAKDVTRRYAKAFNAKTRRQRVESSNNGTRWLKKALRLFRRRDAKLDRDQVEDAELAQKEAREGLPSNVLDFKDHPYYALERHLRRHEVIHPRREAGKVNAGTAAKPRMEAVFRRQDVQSCKSADKWYRLGREVKFGEQPLKHVPARAARRKPLDDDDDDDGGAKQTALYSPQQTRVYIPPPVVRGKIPRNAFGNLDIYVPSMVPAGGVHIRHPLTQQAARTLKIDYADAVTGFKFQGRHGTAVIEGAIVAQEHADAVHATIDGMENEALEDESRTRSLLALRLWSRFLKGLRIAERVASYGDKATADEVKAEMDREEDVELSAADAGGFIAAEAEEPAMPTAGQFSVTELTMQKRPKKNKKKAIEDDVESEVEYVPSSRRSNQRRGVVEDDEDEYAPDQHDGDSGRGFAPQKVDINHDRGGGFVVDDDMGGGFLPDDEAQDDHGAGGFFPDNHGGGGFLPDDNGGGGFVPDDVVADGEGGEGGSFIEPEASTNLLDDGGGGFIAEEEGLSSNGHGQQAAEDIEGGGFLPEASPERAVYPTHEPADPASKSSQSAAPPEGSREPTATTMSIRDADIETESVNAVVEDDDDRGSLLSHDPDDEDAEPDWLESD